MNPRTAAALTASRTLLCGRRCAERSLLLKRRAIGYQHTETAPHRNELTADDLVKTI
jgi:hypothetical protein